MPPAIHLRGPRHGQRDSAKIIRPHGTNVSPASAAPSPTKNSPRRIGYLFLPIDSLPRSKLHVNGLLTRTTNEPYPAPPKLAAPPRSSSPGPSSHVKPCAKTRTASRPRGLTRSAIPGPPRCSPVFTVFADEEALCGSIVTPVDFPQRVSEPLQQKKPKRLNSLRPEQQGGTNGSPNDGARCRYLR